METQKLTWFEEDKITDILSMIEDFYNIYEYEFEKKVYDKPHYDCGDMIKKFERLTEHIVNECKKKNERETCLYMRRLFIDLLWERNNKYDDSDRDFIPALYGY